MSDESSPEARLEAHLQEVERATNIGFGQLPSPREFARMVREANTPEKLQALSDLVASAVLASGGVVAEIDLLDQEAGA